MDALAQVGLKRIADVIERPRAPLAARFGESFVRRLDQALGRDDEPITPRLPVPAYVVERRFAEPIALESDVLATIETLAQELGRLLERRGEGARRLALALFRTDGKVHRLAVGTGAPLRESARIRALFAERLAVLGDACDPGFGFDVIRLAALATERCDPVQTGLAAPDHAAELAHLIDRLGARFGQRRITRLVPQDTHIPEFAVAAVPAAEGRRAENGDYQFRRPREGGAHTPCRQAWQGSELNLGGVSVPAFAGTTEVRAILAVSSKTASLRSGRSTCSSGRSGSRRRRKCPTARRRSSPGGTWCMRSRTPKAPSASPWNGGATNAAAR